jgi:hypothetical protein
MGRGARSRKQISEGYPPGGRQYQVGQSSLLASERWYVNLLTQSRRVRRRALPCEVPSTVHSPKDSIHLTSDEHVGMCWSACDAASLGSVLTADAPIIPFCSFLSHSVDTGYWFT